MTIREIIKYKDIDTYKKLMKIKDKQEKEKVELGDTVENLMKHDSYKRVNGRLKQR